MKEDRAQYAGTKSVYDSHNSTRALSSLAHAHRLASEELYTCRDLDVSRLEVREEPHIPASLSLSSSSSSSSSLLALAFHNAFVTLSKIWYISHFIYKFPILTILGFSNKTSFCMSQEALCLVLLLWTLF
jgi:hypothetical protein